MFKPIPKCTCQTKNLEEVSRTILLPFEDDISETESQKQHKLELNDLEAQGEELLHDLGLIEDNNTKFDDEIQTQEEDKQNELDIQNNIDNAWDAIINDDVKKEENK